MFGNTLGWMISAGIAVLMSYLLYTVAMPPTPTGPSGAKVMAVAFKPIALPEGPDTAVKPGMKEGGENLYQDAMAEVKRNPNLYDKAAEKPANYQIRELKAVELVVKARDYKDVKLFSDQPTELVNYDSIPERLEQIEKAGSICCSMAMPYITDPKYNKGKKLNPDEGRKLLEGAFMLGTRLYNERYSWPELSKGYGLMQQSGEMLERFYKNSTKKDPAKAEAIHTFLSDQEEYQNRVNEAIKIITGVEETQIGGYAGDMFAIALSDDADIMFRTEAMKHIGRYRFNSVSKGDQFRARKILETLPADPKLTAPNLRPLKAAADAAHDLTLEKYNQFGR